MNRSHLLLSKVAMAALSVCLTGLTHAAAQNVTDPSTTAGASQTQDGTAGQDNTAAEIESLRAQLSALQARVGEIQQKQLSAADVDKVVREVMNDAYKRSQLLSTDGSLSVGYDKGLFIKSEDGSFLLKPNVLFQFRGIANYAEESTAGKDSDSTESGYEVRRLRIRLAGNAFSKDLTYLFQYDVNRSNGNDRLLDAWAQYRFAPNWAIKAGQYKVRITSERNTQPSSLMAVDRSLAENQIGGEQVDRVQGLALVYGGTKDNPLRVEYTLDDGANSANTNYQDQTSASFGTGARLEYKLAGDWKSMSDYSAKGTKETFAAAGAGAHYSDTESGGLLISSADLHVEHPSGWSVLTAVNGRSTFTRNTSTGDEDRFDYGGTAQLSYLLSPAIEPFARWSYVNFDAANNGNNYNEAALGINYYFGQDGEFHHRAKITTDIVYLPDGGPSGASGLDIVQSDGSQFLLRTQLTLQF